MDREGNTLADEDALVKRAQRGARDAFAELYTRHADEVRSFVRSRVRDATLAEDVVAATWLDAWKSIRRFAGENRPFKPWLIGVARYELLTHVTLARDLHSLEELHAAGENWQQGADLGPSTEETAIVQAELREALMALAVLPHRRRTAILLQVQQSLSEVAIARVMDTTPLAVRFLLHRGRQQLREACGLPPAGQGRAGSRRSRVRDLLAQDPSRSGADLARQLRVSVGHGGRLRRAVLEEAVGR